MGKPELKTDERYATNFARIQSGNRDDVDNFLAEWCKTKSTSEVEHIFEEAGLPATRVNTYQEVAGRPQTEARDMLQPTELSDGKEVPLTGPAAKFSKTPTRIRNPAPPLGKDTKEVLLNLGYNDSEINHLTKLKVI
jgi:Predicted acyl-CoA transferases/carnitine dehydratase